MARVAHDLHADAVGLLDDLGALAAVGGVGVERIQAGDFAADPCATTSAAASRSCTLAAVIVTANSSVDHQMTFTPLDLLACVQSGVATPCAVLRVLCASMIAAVGSGALSMRSRHC